VYRWQIQMATSILHRATGVFLSVGAHHRRRPAGPDDGARILELLHRPCRGLVWPRVPVRVDMVVRLSPVQWHPPVVQDFAIGFSIPAFIRSSWLSVIGSLVITLLVWAYVMFGGAA
jgi:succinate dehydrogenase / fumarate reductase cytochrome b subunit